MKSKQQKYEEAVERNLRSVSVRIASGDLPGYMRGDLRQALTALGIRARDTSYSSRVERLVAQASHLTGSKGQDRVPGPQTPRGVRHQKNPKGKAAKKGGAK